ncbi:MAG: phosphate ABC transporter permease PstA [Polyangiaceae bacterium]
MANYARRKLLDFALYVACALSVLLALLPLSSVLGYVFVRGVGGLSWAFFSELPRPIGEAGGGMAHALWGSVQVLGIACALGVPVGVLAGVHLAEFGSSRLSTAVRLAADVLAGVPSIAVGLFVYALMVLTTQRFSAWAGGVALSVLMLPGVVRTTEEMLKLVPESLREAALGLGVSRFRTCLHVLLRTAAPGIGVGIMLSVARVAGESAPLLFTAFNNRFWAESLSEPTATLPVNIYTDAVSPYDEWHQRAWTCALVLVTLILILSSIARWLTRSRAGAS